MGDVIRSSVGTVQSCLGRLHGAEILLENPKNRRGETIFKLPASCKFWPPWMKRRRLDWARSQDWDARAAQDVAAARARGANLGALVDKKEHRASFLRRKAEQKQAEATASSVPHSSGLVEAAAVAQAEVPAQHLPAFSGAVFSFDSPS